MKYFISAQSENYDFEGVIDNVDLSTAITEARSAMCEAWDNMEEAFDAFLRVWSFDGPDPEDHIDTSSLGHPDAEFMMAAGETSNGMGTGGIKITWWN